MLQLIGIDPFYNRTITRYNLIRFNSNRIYLLYLESVYYRRVIILLITKKPKVKNFPFFTGCSRSSLLERQYKTRVRDQYCGRIKGRCKFTIDYIREYR